MSAAREFIEQSPYAEFPDMLVTLELCRVLAQIEGRRVGEALRRCAAALAVRADNKNLRNTLAEMSISMFPETQITRIRATIAKMESALTREMRKI